MTVIYPSPIFGPIHSRRLGISLGVNLLPPDGKSCTFDCLYCECGFNHDFRPHLPMPTRQRVADALEEKLKDMKENGPKPDVITFAGNGEPTLHPHFAEIIDDVIRLRNKYFPDAKVSVLSNSTMITRKDVFEALKKVDNNILKLDTFNPDYIEHIDRPNIRYDVKAIVEQMQKFEGHCIIQTMFLKGTYNGKDVDNTSDKFVLPWIETLKKIAPMEVMIYTIDRETPAHNLKKASHEDLDRIAKMVKQAGLKVQEAF